jgi:predicted patatin/cPLA2 family phospholipase
MPGHRVTELLAERAKEGSRPGARTDGSRLVLAVEGAGMRGVVSAGMALALQQLGFLPLFDAVYGTSTGAVSGALLLSVRPETLRSWAEPKYAEAVFRMRNALRGRPVVDLRALIEAGSAGTLDSPVELHPLATDAETGQVADLYEHIVDGASLRLALRAGCALPVLTGGAVSVGGRRYYDANVTRSVPIRQALKDGATHVLVLRARRGSALPRRRGAGPGSRLIARVALRDATPDLRRAFLDRRAQTAADDRLLAFHDTNPDSGPAVLSIHPDPAAPYVGRRPSGREILQTAFDAGREAVFTRLGEFF